MLKVNSVVFSMLLISVPVVIHAKSPCYDLATNTYFDSDMAPRVATRENMREAREEMADTETLCKRLVQAVKTKVTTSARIREGSEENIKKAKIKFDEDGDMDKFEYEKYLYNILMGIADIADE